MADHLFSVDIEDLPNRFEPLPVVFDSNPMGCDTGGLAWAADISDLSSLSSLSDSNIEMTESKRVHTSQTTSGSAEPRSLSSFHSPLVAINFFLLYFLGRISLGDGWCCLVSLINK
jgi:hypothetical protein